MILNLTEQHVGTIHLVQNNTLHLLIVLFLDLYTFTETLVPLPSSRTGDFSDNRLRTNGTPSTDTPEFFHSFYNNPRTPFPCKLYFTVFQIVVTVDITVSFIFQMDYLT